MLTVRSYLKRPRKEIQQELNLDNDVPSYLIYLQHPEICYIPIEHEAARRLIKPQDKFFSGAITLHDGDAMFFGFETAEFEIWRTFITALLQWQSDGQAEVHFTDSPYRMIWTPVGTDQIEFVLMYPKRYLILKRFPCSEFFTTVVDGLIFFFEKVIEYGNEVERNHRTVQFLREIRETL